jgi:hypothetical protein
MLQALLVSKMVLVQFHRYYTFLCLHTVILPSYIKNILKRQSELITYAHTYVEGMYVGWWKDIFELDLCMCHWLFSSMTVLWTFQNIQTYCVYLSLFFLLNFPFFLLLLLSLSFFPFFLFSTSLSLFLFLYCPFSTSLPLHVSFFPFIFLSLPFLIYFSLSLTLKSLSLSPLSLSLSLCLPLTQIYLLPFTSVF